jgi:hypothetical protein
MRSLEDGSTAMMPETMIISKVCQKQTSAEFRLTAHRTGAWVRHDGHRRTDEFAWVTLRRDAI